MREAAPDPPTLAAVVGRNARILRGEVPGDRLASAARNHGLNWGTGRIADLEAGRVSPTLPTLIAVALALGDVRGAPIALADLLAHDGFVSVTGDLILTGNALVRYVSGDDVQIQMRDYPGGLDEVARLRENIASVLRPLHPLAEKVDPMLAAGISRRAGEAEERAAKALGVHLHDVIVASAYLWGRTLSDERDRRAGDEASAQKRGRITRQLYDELKAALDGES